MSGRKKMPIYQYDKNGRFLREWESKAELEKFYNLKKGNLLSGKSYRKMSDGTYISDFRIGRWPLMKQVKIDNCPYCVEKRKNQKPVEVFNLLGEKIAEFDSLATLTKMTGMNKATLFTRAKEEFKNNNNDNLIFKFKK